MPPIAAIIASVVASAATVGTSLYQAQDYKGPDTNQAALDASNQSSQQAKDAAGLEAQKTALLHRAAPDAQSATGGALAPDAFAAFTSMLAGMPGDNQFAQRILSPQNGSGSSLVPSTSSPQMSTMGSPSSPVSGAGHEDGGMMSMIMNLFNGSGNGNSSVAGGSDSSSGGGSGNGMEDMRNSFAYGM